MSPLHALLMACILTACAALPLAEGPVTVEVRREGERHVICRNGEPYYIKGAVYWARPDGLFPMSGIQERGGNSVRAGGGNPDAIVNEADRLGTTVTVGLPMRMEWADGSDYDDPPAVQAQLRRVQEMVLKYKDHPSVLLWGIGNELSTFYTRQSVWTAVNGVAEWVHEVDPHHPTMTVLGDSPGFAETIPEIRERCPAIDVLGFNVYKGIERIPGIVREAGWDKPYLITEWGPSGHWQVPKTSWKAPIEETSSRKAEVYQQRYEDTMLKDPERCSGSYVFFWQWRQETTFTWYGMFLQTGERTEAVNVMQYLWTGAWPANRAPRIEPPVIDGLAATESITLRPGGVPSGPRTM